MHIWIIDKKVPLPFLVLCLENRSPYMSERLDLMKREKRDEEKMRQMMSVEMILCLAFTISPHNGG